MLVEVQNGFRDVESVVPLALRDGLVPGPDTNLQSRLNPLTSARGL